MTRRKFTTQSVAMGMSLLSSALVSDHLMAETHKHIRPGHDDTLWKGERHMKSGQAPISIQSSTLIVNDLDKVTGFYLSVLGLEPLRSDGETQELGAGGQTLLILQRDRHSRRYPREAGLFHNAFLMPDRASLGRWLRHAAEQSVRLTGAADHDVSEAIYLDDPEGNGIEVYADRPETGWQTMPDGQIKMGSHRLDLHSILDAGNGPWARAPEDLIIGHVHLQVGHVDAFHAFMTKQLGQELMLFEGSAGFYATGGYHHHFAGNVWNSSCAGQRSPDSTGLAGITLKTDGSRVQSSELVDPWGTRYSVEQSQD